MVNEEVLRAIRADADQQPDIIKGTGYRPTGLEENPVMVESDGPFGVSCNMCKQFEGWSGNVSLHTLVKWAQRHQHDEPSPATCDYPGGASIFTDTNGKFTCRCIICSRCGHHTGNNTQGHYWGYCHHTRTVRNFHFCCPDDCALG